MRTPSWEIMMTIRFEISLEIEQQIRTSGVDLDRDAKEVYLMEQYRQAKISHRQLEAALALSFNETEQLLRQRGMGQDLDVDDFEVGREILRSARSQ
jgi:predicted HTH domain antitoxin